mgnify:CR=1 FL=1
MAYYIIDTCTGCTACIKRCPTEAITGERKQLHVIDPELCIDCGACGVVCPDEAIYDNHDNLCDLLKAPQRPKAFVDLQACTGCEWCVWACPFDALTMEKSPGEGAFANVVAVIDKKCVGCTLCELDCPYDAIHVWRSDDPRVQERKDRNRTYVERVAAAAPAAAEAAPAADKAKAA